MKKIALHSVPRSGSSWLGEIINSNPGVNYSFQPLFSYEFKSYLNECSSSEDIDDFFNKIASTKDDFIRQSSDRDNGKKPIFFKDNQHAIAYKEVRYHYILENLLKKDSNLKVVGLIRDPRAVIASWYSAPREFRTDLGWKLDDELIDASSKNSGRREEYFGLKAWVEVTQYFHNLNKLYPDEFILVSYSDLLENTDFEVSKLFSLLGLDYSEQTKKFICNDDCVDGDYSVFKNKKSDDSWRKILSKDIVEQIESYVNSNGLGSYLR